MANYKEKEKEKPQSIEETLLRELRFGGLDKDNLKELVGIVAGIHRSGLKRLKAFPLGIPVVDGIRVSGVLEVSETGKFLNEYLPRASRLGELRLFPYGIPWPELVRVRIDLGTLGEKQFDQF